MRMSDWSSDVCSSDLLAAITGKRRDRARLLDLSRVCSTGDQDAHPDGDEERESFGALRRAELLYDRKDQWPDRKSVVEGKSVSVRVDLGGRRMIKKHSIKESDET